MADQPASLQSSTPQASAADAQSRGDSPAASSAEHTDPVGADTPGTDIPGTGEGTNFTIGPRVFRAVSAQPYDRNSDDPLYRPLRIFTQDPATSRLEGAVALVNVPYEPLEPGPIGHLFEIDNYDGYQHLHYRRADLDAPEVLIRDGYDPSASSPPFHQQMVYAVCSTVYSAFRAALGRDIAWGFETSRPGDGPLRLVLRPHAHEGKNAWYDKERGEICFGYFQADEKVIGRNMPGGFVFTCLSHDIIAHEVTHALLDGLRSHFVLPTGPDVLGFHEGFADLIAIFQHFSYDKVLQVAIRKSRGNLAHADLLTDIARQFGHTTGSDMPLRSAIASDDGDSLYDPDLEMHDLGSVLVTAVFDAFLTIYHRKTAQYIRLATNGSGLLPEGNLPPDLETILAEEASKLAGQFLTICIRAIDYCPPVDLELGEFLRAVITADYDLVPDDPWGYREAWIDAFQRHNIYPRNVSNLSEDSLLWQPPRRKIARGETLQLSFAELKFSINPGRSSGKQELQRQACALGRIIARPEYAGEFGLAVPNDPKLSGGKVDLPCVESVRSSRRIGPNGQIAFDLVAEVTQRRTILNPDGSQFDYYGGSTVILGPRGDIRYVISKNVLSEERLQRQRAFMSSPSGLRFWHAENGRRTPKPQLFKLLEEQSPPQ